MHTLYHVFETCNLASIMKHGLLPGIKPSIMSIGPAGQDVRMLENVVYAFQHAEDAVRMAFRIAWNLDPGSEPHVWIVQFKWYGEMIPDPHWESQIGRMPWVGLPGPVPVESFIHVVPFLPGAVDARGYRLKYNLSPIKGWLRLRKR